MASSTAEGGYDPIWEGGPEDGWQEDREVFAREKQTDPASGKTKDTLYVTEAAKKHWSDKNPRKFTPEIAIKIVQYVGGTGCFMETCAAAAGISKETLYVWMRAGEKPSDPRSTEELRAWKRMLDEAVATTEARAAQGILNIGYAGTWQALAWYLERRHPARWGRKDTTMHANPDGSPLAPQQVAFAIVDPKKDDEGGGPAPCAATTD